jgi:plastocyanin
MRRGHAIVLLVVALALVTAACSSTSSSSSTSTSSSASSPASPTAGGGGASGTTIDVSGFAFHPDSLDVSAGSVTLTVTNNDTTTHTFTLDDGSSSTQLPAGETTTIKLDLAQTVGFHCNIHPSMTGTLNVA